MALLTSDNQTKLLDMFVEEGLATRESVDKARAEAQASGKPVGTLLVEEGIVDDELLVHGIAKISGVPYINISTSIIDQSVLNLLPGDIAERFMAVPLAETNNRLAVAMIDANNVQAVDYLAS